MRIRTISLFCIRFIRFKFAIRKIPFIKALLQQCCVCFVLSDLLAYYSRLDGTDGNNALRTIYSIVYI